MITTFLVFLLVLMIACSLGAIGEDSKDRRGECVALTLAAMFAFVAMNWIR